ncbi:MAG TPA: 3-isopropylmalate dehydratase [Bordetella sp.]|nr:3-isopropylmalate dehydratase [Bordetella sp.]
MNLIYQGRCWKLDDDVSSDELISARHVFEYDPEQLRKHLLAETRPELATQAKPGDLIVAGKRFAHGSQHTHPFLAMKAMGLGLLAHRLFRPPFRLAIYSGVPLLELGEEALDMFGDGEQMHVDFNTGLITNITRGQQLEATPLPDFLLQIVQAGGGLGYLRDTREHPASLETSHDT